MTDSMLPFFSFIRKFWISIALCIVILVLCFMPTEPLPKVPMTNFDKVVHCLMFWALSGVVFFDNTNYLRRAIERPRILRGSFLFPVLFSGLIEIGQTLFTTYRTGDWWDFFYDVIGAMLGCLSGLLINRRLRTA